jgi:hypothetical protein
MDEKTSKRFWDKVKRDSDNGCWEWTSAIGSKYGHGSFSLNGKPVYAHRLSWEIHNGSIPKGKIVCHHCDNPKCVNPKHLFMGTQRENVADMMRKGRHKPPPKKIREPKPGYFKKITAQQVEEIKGLRLMGIKLSRIANQFGVSDSMVSRIASGSRRS